jgi:glycosyltransferase involved in cell wall biosynthesis
MSVKTFGIYLAYRERVELVGEGNGRYLASLLCGAADSKEVRFVVAAPSWLRPDVERLLRESGLSPDSVELLSPARPVAVLQLADWMEKRPKATVAAVRPRRRSTWWPRIAARVDACLVTILGLRSVTALVLIGILIAPAALLFLLGREVVRGAKRFLGRLRSRRAPGDPQPKAGIKEYRKKLVRLLRRLGRSKRAVDAEVKALHALIHARADIGAWYCPTPLFPTFADLRVPRLLGFPDMLLAEMPVSFASIGGQGMLDRYEKVRALVRAHERFVCYSEHVKHTVLADRLGVPPDQVAVIPHAACPLDQFLALRGFPDNENASNVYTRKIFWQILHSHGVAGIFGHQDETIGDVRFFIYPTQFRPNKNIVTLLRAYEWLLKTRGIPHKLLLTGNRSHMPEIGEFVSRHGLERDVVFLSRLRERELAACYRLADVAVNTSLSEGGCPFTLTESLSVRTPVVMSRLAVTTEVIDDKELLDVMCFDPSDYLDVATRMEWACHNRQELLDRQMTLYAHLSQRTWKHVAKEVGGVLESIAAKQGSLSR